MKNHASPCFGLIGELTARQAGRDHFRDIPLGERFLVLHEVDLPGYDLLGFFPNFKPQVVNEYEKNYSGYLGKGTYKIVGNIFDDPRLLQFNMEYPKLLEIYGFVYNGCANYEGWEKKYKHYKVFISVTKRDRLGPKEFDFSIGHAEAHIMDTAPTIIPLHEDLNIRELTEKIEYYENGK